MAMQLRIEAKEGVYYPREDSYLLCDVVEKHAFGRVLDLGTGSGIQGIVAAKKGCHVTFADIDGKALESARHNAALNGVVGEFVLSDLFGSINKRFDTIIFNPPYLPSEGKRIAALDGGKGGRELIKRFLKDYRRHLNKKGFALLLESSYSGYEKEVERGAEVLARAHYFFEDLIVLRLKDK